MCRTVFSSEKYVGYSYSFVFVTHGTSVHCYNARMRIYNSYAIFTRKNNTQARCIERYLEEYLQNYRPALWQGPLTEADLVLVIGGDGTLLEVARTLRGSSAHVLSLHVGHVGFLTSVREIDRFIEVVEKALKGDLQKMALPVSCLTHLHAAGASTFSVINDVLVERTMTWITMHVEGVRGTDILFRKDIRGSGVCICTPIGSTTGMASHYQSPLIDPAMQAFYVKGTNDIRGPAPGLLISATEQVLRVTVDDIEPNPGIPETCRQPPGLFTDGIQVAELAIGDVIEIKYYPQGITLLREFGDAHWDRLLSLRR